MRAEMNLLAEAIADELFGAGRAGQPVYTLADAPALARIVARAGLEGDPTAALAGYVRSVLSIDELGEPAFSLQARESRSHSHQPLETPRVLPVLVILTLAAEHMQADSDAPAHNYYSRLHALLEVPPARQLRFEEGYRRHAAAIWGSLNSWLEAWEGLRGVPTAYAIGGHAFIGLPLSQAVVRQHDRSGLHTLFALEGMTPGSRLASADMDAAMAPYAARTPSPLSSNLRRLWTNAASRERIVEAACLELDSWDGSDQQAFSRSQFPVTTRLLAFLRNFPRKSIEFNILIPNASTESVVARFQTESGEVVVPTMAGTGGSARLVSVEAVATESLLGDTLIGELGVENAHPFGRRPRRVVPLRWDDLQGAFVEVERISLGEDTLVLAREDSRIRVEGYLAAHARPGWAQLLELRGVPDGWVIFEHVQIVSGPSTTSVHLDLLPLVSRTRTSLTLRGGFVMPGLLRKWSSLEPPEVVALAAEASLLAVRIYSGSAITEDAVVVQAQEDGDLLIVSLKNFNLTDGEYVVAMFVDGAARPSSTALLRLRSADTPQFSVDEEDIRLVYSPGASKTWPMSGGAANWPTYINGARVVGSVIDSRADTVEMPEFAPRARIQRPDSGWKASIGIPMTENSCLLTGKHRFHLPPTGPNAVQTRSIDGECETCGLVKRFAGTPWAARKRDASASETSRIVVIPPIVQSDAPAFEVAFDAMNHIGHGSYGTFERISAQVEGSGLFADTFLRRQEVVGNIDVARDDWLQVTEWAVNSATLIPVAAGRWTLVGSRSHGLLDLLKAALGDHAHVIESTEADISRVEVASDSGLLELQRSDLAEIGVTLLAKSPSMEMIKMLPTIGAVAVELSRIVVPSFRTAERWNTGAASWESTDSLASVGAYRLKEFRSLYVVRSVEDLDSGRVGIGNAQIVKHIANMWAKDPLVGYNARSGSVVAPLGADLPGLYGRALSVASGKAPREIVRNKMIQYPSVPRDVADAIFFKLSE